MDSFLFIFLVFIFFSSHCEFHLSSPDSFRAISFYSYSREKKTCYIVSTCGNWHMQRRILWKKKKKNIENYITKSISASIFFPHIQKCGVHCWTCYLCLRQFFHLPNLWQSKIFIAFTRKRKIAFFSSSHQSRYKNQHFLRLLSPFFVKKMKCSWS